MSEKTVRRGVSAIAILLGICAALVFRSGFADPAEGPSLPPIEESAVSATLAAVQIAAGPEAAKAAFPLRIARNRRSLADASGKPFLIQGDAAWSLIAQLGRANADIYLRRRRDYGFNAVLVNLLEKKFASNAPSNIYGKPPFNTPGDFGTPNEQYFAHADWIIRRAASYGILVLLTPAYLGIGGGDQGWYQDLVAAGPAAARRYGRFLGKRYASFKNILWVAGGDYDPPQERVVSELMKGIAEFDPRALTTMHCGPGTPAALCLDDKSWLDVNNIYVYGDVADSALAESRRRPLRPFFLIESTYENEHGVDTRQLRAHAYQTVLSGAAGQVFGNNPMWHFDGPGLYSTSMTWKQALTSDGSRSMSFLRSLLEKLQWWRLGPKDGFLHPVGGTGDNKVVAALDKRGLFALVYVPDGQKVRLDLTLMRRNRVQARWFDPSRGIMRKPIRNSPFTTKRAHTFAPPAKNGGGDRDWVLYLKSVKRRSATDSGQTDPSDAIVPEGMQ